MRILHVVTLVSPDGAFGGPVRVAANQAATLRARGHAVQVVGGTRGYDAPPQDLAGTPARLFTVRSAVPGTGFSGLSSTELHRWLATRLPEVDVVHVHLGRDLVTLPAAWAAVRSGVPCVVQPHGMVVPSDNRLAPLVDGLLTRRVLRGASAVLHLTDEEERGLRAVAGPLPTLQRLGNGVPLTADVPALPARPEVLFCARLHPRKRPLLFVDTAKRLLDAGVEADFVLVGPDEGEGAAVARAVADRDPARLRWEGSLDPSETLARMRRASMLVLPSVDEPYPMAVLEALSVGRPVVVTDSCGLAPAVREHGCGLVVDATPEALLDAVRHLLDRPEVLASMHRRAMAAAAETFSMEAVGDRLEQVYSAAVATESSAT